MEGLGIEGAVEGVVPEEAAREAREGLLADRDEEAAQRYERRVARVREEIVVGRQRIAARRLELRLRHSKLREAVNACIEAHVRLSVGANVGDIETMTDGAGEVVTLEEIEALGVDDAVGIERMEAKMELLRKRIRQAEEERAREEEVRVGHVPGAPRRAGWVGRSLRDYVEGGTREGEPHAEGEGKGGGAGSEEQCEEVRRVLEEAAALSDERLSMELAVGFEAVGRIVDEEQRRTFEQRYLAEANQRVGRVRERVRFHEEIQGLMDELEVFPELSQNEDVLLLRKFLGLEMPVDWKEIRGRVREQIEAATVRREREERRLAVVESLRELGYETQEGLGTAFAQGGRLVMHKATETEYGVEVVADASLDHIQTAMVRYAANREISEQQRLRDREREELWCEDHAALRRKLRERGWDAEFRMQRSPGEHPVRVVVDPARVERAVADRERKPSQKPGREAAG